ncbi:MAG: hypothetical protein F6K15_34365, partial [Okeania sp. SIO2B3]
IPNGFDLHLNRPSVIFVLHGQCLEREGQTTPGNVVPACIQCNSSKNNQDVFEWMDKKSITPHPEFIDRIIISECGLYG